MDKTINHEKMDYSSTNKDKLQSAQDFIKAFTNDSSPPQDYTHPIDLTTLLRT